MRPGTTRGIALLWREEVYVTWVRTCFWRENVCVCAFLGKTIGIGIGIWIEERGGMFMIVAALRWRCCTRTYVTLRLTPLRCSIGR